MTTTCRLRGFTLVEMLVTILILGMLLAMSVPALQKSGRMQQLRGSSETIAGQLRMAREKAIATGRTQIMHFTMNYPPGSEWDYHIHNATVEAGWALPRGVSWYARPSSVDFSKDGTVDNHGYNLIVVQNAVGKRDTVVIQPSGLVITR